MKVALMLEINILPLLKSKRIHILFFNDQFIISSTIGFQGPMRNNDISVNAICSSENVDILLFI